ncbi:hypothetical protein [Aliiglaciecola litoralis]|uniref:Uncharacterized protein n=1 Tax=Aliiglaciecola litoralis TaxID=582857 RepID=A0ABN1LUF3_9ALTE
MKLEYIFILFFPLCSLASPPIESFALDEDSAKLLGFSYSITVDKLSKMIELQGPAQLKNGCTPIALGNFLIGPDEEQISAFIGSPNVSEPQALGFVSPDSDNKLIVFIDYSCPDGFSSDSRRYEVSTN